MSREIELKDLMSRPEGDVVEAIGGILPYRTVAVVYGVGEADTTAFMADLVASLACGKEWFGYPTNGEHSTLQCVRDALGIVRRRFEAWERVHKGVIPDENFVVEQRVSLSTPAGVEALSEAIHGTEYCSVNLVALDLPPPKPASATSRGDPGAGYDALITGAVDLLGAGYDCQIVILHEPASMRAQPGVQAHWSDDPRVDVAISVRCNQRGEHYWRLEKPQYKAPRYHAFDLVGVDLGTKAGLPETYLVARKAEGDPLAQDPKDPPKKHLDAVVDMLRSLEAGSGPSGKGRASPTSRAGISGRALLSACRRRATQAEGGLAAGCVKAALCSLIRTGRVLERKGRLFLPADPLSEVR